MANSRQLLSSPTDWRALVNRLWMLLCSGAALLCAGLLLALMAILVLRGMPVLDGSFLLTATRGFGSSGGVLYQILGTLLLVAGAAVLVFPLALSIALCHNEYLHGAWARAVAVLIYALNGIPSIVFGMFGLIVFVHLLGTGAAWWVGSLVLALMILPTVTMAAHAAIQRIPRIYRESAMALGLNEWQLMRKVLLPQAIGGGLTGLLLGLARAAGETAPVMLVATAFSGVSVPGSWSEPVLSLPTHILLLAQQAADPHAVQHAWGASLVLLLLVMLLSLAALRVRYFYRFLR